MPRLCLPTRVEGVLANFSLSDTHVSFRENSDQSVLNFLSKNGLLSSQGLGLPSFPLPNPVLQAGRSHSSFPVVCMG